MGRPLPQNPFSSLPVAEWLDVLMSTGPVETRYRAWSAVITLQMPDDAWPHVVKLLSDAEPELRAAAAHWLAVSKNRGLLALLTERQADLRDPVTRLLVDSDPDARLAAAEAAVAWKIDSATVAETVLHVLNDPQSETTSLATAVRLVSQLPDVAGQSVPRLAELLSLDSAEVREAAAQALAELGPDAQSAATALVAALEDEEPLVREFAARALGQLASIDDAIRQGLQAAASDEDTVVAAAAQESLSRLGGLP